MGEYISGLRCTLCGHLQSDLGKDLLCEKCNAFTQVEYDYQRLLKSLDRRTVMSRPNTMWKYREVLPVRNAENIVTLGEGGTPLLTSRKLGAALGLDHLYFKDTSRNPTGSFKDYSASVTISKAREIGYDSIVLASGGNASSAFAAYAAAGGLAFYALMLPITNATMLSQNLVFGARGFIVNGTAADAGAVASRLARRYGWMNAATPSNPYRVEGKKIMAYEIFEQLGWRMPDRIVCPTAGGTSIIGMWKAFEEMRQLGWTDQCIKLDCIQPEGCAPVVKAWREGKAEIAPWGKPNSIAIGLQAPNPAGGSLILRILAASASHAETVTDDELRQAQLLLAQTEGLYVEPSAAASVAGLRRMREIGVISSEETVVCMLTGTGLKAPDITASMLERPPVLSPDTDSLPDSYYGKPGRLGAARAREVVGAETATPGRDPEGSPTLTGTPP